MSTEPNPVRAARRGVGMSIAELARRARVTRRTVYLIESGRPARVETYVRLAHALNVPVSRLIEPIVAGIPA